MASENEKKYGGILGTIKNEAEQGVEDAVNSVTQMATIANKVGGYLKRDITNEINWLKLSPKEKAAVKQKEKAEKEAKEAKAKEKKEGEKKAQEAEKARLEEVKKSYILHTAVIICPFAEHESYVVVPQSHGEFIHGIPQLNVSDSKPEINIRSFGICKSPKNPSVQEAAEKIVDEIKNRKKSFMEKVMDLFSKTPSSKVSDDLVSKCAGVCKPQIFSEWINGKEDVLIDGKPALLGKCKIQCGYGGEITIYTSGQISE